MIISALQVFRDFVTDLVPSSGVWKPRKSEIRAWAADIETRLTAFVTALGGKIYASLATMTADLTPASGTPALIFADASNVGLYRKVGGTGSGSWAKELDFVPGTQFIKGSDVGAGTANAIQITTNLPVGASGRQLIWTNVFRPNDAANPTITIPGVGTLLLKNAQGASFFAGQVPQFLLGVVDGTNFQSLFDMPSEATIIQLGAIDTRFAAEESARTNADAAQVADIVSLAASDGTMAGDSPELFTASLTGAPAAGQSVAGAVVETVDGVGRVLTKSGEWSVGTLRRFSLAQTVKQRIDWDLLRKVGSGDPAGDTIECRIKFLNASLAQVGDVVQFAATPAAGERIVRAATINSEAGTGVDRVWPAGAVYAVPYVRTYNAATTTSLIRVGCRPVFDVPTSEQIATIAVGVAAALGYSDLAARWARDPGEVVAGYLSALGYSLQSKGWAEQSQAYLVAFQAIIGGQKESRHKYDIAAGAVVPTITETGVIMKVFLNGLLVDLENFTITNSGKTITPITPIYGIEKAVVFYV